ncbi:hypothetical protein BDV93DRAFT_443356 [Ceratobasidium sp. AG-I]|nr:hypothetical protein BDV93DRAFT_443356 [Ceratobasidium sp. AG-I]
MPIIVSTRFNPREEDIRGADLVLVSSDKIRFYVHQNTLLRQSSNHFGSLLPETIWAQPMDASDIVASLAFVNVNYTADVLNVLLHAIYGFSVQSYKPSPAILRETIVALANLGFSIETFLVPHSELYMLYLQAAATEPLPMYALAAEHSLESLAVSVSTFTLSVSLSDLTDDLAEQIGPTYLRRLFFLHLGRTDALKRILYPPPASHPIASGLPSPHSSPSDQSCSPSNQQNVARIWAFACSSAVIDNHPNNLIRMLTPMSAQLPCILCGQTLMDRVRKLVSDWSDIKNTI